MAVHKPVLLHEMLDYLNPKAGGLYVDATFGGGGYTRAILAKEPTCTVVAIDRDPAAEQRAKLLQREYPGRLHFLNGCFSELDSLLGAFPSPDGIVFDFGVSSFQLDEKDRGFSFRLNGPLDMRMSNSGITAAEVVNTFSEEDLAKIIYLYGEEPKSRQIAREIVNYRKQKLLTTTTELANIVRQIVFRRDGIDPATLTFQGLRIFVNNELMEIDKALRKCLDFLAAEGKILTVTFHSLEDRLVKNWFQQHKNNDSDSAVLAPKIASLSKKPVVPSPGEIALNPRSRSAKLRVFAISPLRA